MSKNINQITTAAASILATDKLYLGRSPFGITDDRYILGSSILAQVAPLTTKGDIYTYSTVNARLAVAVGDGKILQVSSGAATGLAWSTPTYPSASGTVGKILRSDGTNNIYTTATFADTYAVSTLLYAASANTVSGLATTNRAALATNATGVPNWLALTDGQIVVGSTAGAPAAATLSAGPGISIANGSNTVTISGTGSGIGWTEVTGTTQLIVADNGYVANNAGLVTFTMPATAAFGTVISIMGKGAGGWLIQGVAAQIIHVGSVATSAAGSVASTNRYDSIDLVCITANSEWACLSGPQGTLTII